MPPNDFFSLYPNFDHDPAASVIEEFQRLSLQQGWKEKGKKYQKIRQKCLAEEFEYHYGQASTKLGGFQNLCADVRISPIPPSIKQCKKVSLACHCLDMISLTASPELLGSRARICQPRRPYRLLPAREGGENLQIQG